MPSCGSDERNPRGSAGFAHGVRPDARLDFPDMGLAEQKHAKPGLPDTSADGQRHGISHQLPVIIKLQPFFLSFRLQLAYKRRLVDPDTHG